MTDVPEAVKAAAVVLHDDDCGDGETTATCGRWRSGNYPAGQQTHIGYYEDRARRALEAAAALPPCPACGCRTLSDPDARECGCDAGCNDGPHAPGVNALIAAERERTRRLAIDAGAWFTERVETPADTFPPTVTVTERVRPFADLLGGDA